VRPAAELTAARFDRHLDLRWRRTSYSDITSEAHDALVASEPEQPLLADEPETATAVVTGEAADVPELQRPSPLGDMPVGVQFGTFVHRVFQATDFAAPDLGAELSERVVAAGGPVAVVTGLRAAIETPLGPLAGGLRLRDLERENRLDELSFELPLAGGDDPTGRLTLAALAATLRQHLPPEDPVARYAARLDDPALRSTVRGFLTGSIDLVMRVPGPRFAIVDYKTNWLGPSDEPLRLLHYAEGALVAEMNRAHYHLQALLYMVALHRYLRWRLPGYDPDRHLAGVLYLFLRGMDGVPGAGVFAWPAPGTLVSALSDVLDEGGT
jgi:exodeoxyribonuclease V beta subunit